MSREVADRVVRPNKILPYIGPMILIIEYDVVMIKQNVTHVCDLYHVANADVEGPEYADVSLHGESGGYANA